jgi:hypothetical protein
VSVRRSSGGRLGSAAASVAFLLVPRASSLGPRSKEAARTLSSIRGAILTSSLCSWIKRMRSDWETSSNSLASVTLDPSSKAGSQSYTPTLWLQASGCVGESGRLVMGWKKAPQIRARIEALLYPR